MNLSSYADRTTEKVTEHAQAIATGESIIPGVGTRDLAIFAGIIVTALLLLGARAFNVPIPQVLGQRVSTENALTLYTTFAGIGGFLANLIASALISTVGGETVTIASILPPILIQILGAVIAAVTFPSGEASII